MYEENNEKGNTFITDKEENSPDKFEIISFKFFAENEFLFENYRKYRTVFQEKEVDYIKSELSFYNLNYKKTDWELKIDYEITSGDGRKDNFDLVLKVSKDEPFVRACEGYGNATKGLYWKKGGYKWTARIDGKIVAYEGIFIENLGFAGNNGMPYIMLEEVKLFNNDNHPKESLFSNRLYCKSFNRAQTEVVDVELTARNLLIGKYNWAGEFIFIFRTALGEKKAEIRKIQITNRQDIKIKVDAIHKRKLFFSGGIYYVEIIFMEKLIAKIPFKICDEEELSTIEEHKIFFPDEKDYFLNPVNGEDIFSKLNEMTGLEEVKETVNNQLTYFKYLKLKKNKGSSKNKKINLNSLFIGNPGTGKTVVARLLGKIYKDIGLLSSGHVYEVGRPELVAGYIGHTALQVREAIEKARGGVLFIDEAYSLAREKDDKRDFGAEVIEVLIKEMSDGPGDIAIIAAGYSDEMNIFLESNPGLKSRFKYTFHFKDYSPDKLLEIAEHHCRKKNLRMSPVAKINLQKIITKAWRNRDRTFGNARFVKEMIDKAEMNLSLRVMKHYNPQKSPKYLMTRLENIDFKNAIATIANNAVINLPIDEEGLSEALEELKSLEGLANVKADMEKLAKLIRFYKEEGRNTLSKISLHSVFTGNPGTGKTTVARIIAKIYCALGILERGHLVECSRESLVSGYTGQTAIKTAMLIEKAIGGVLFIDEAYSLASSNDNDFGKEVIETLLKKMEDRRGEFVVICAGYSEQMKYFLDSNPGLRSRFDRVIEFPDYTNQELLMIAFKLLGVHDFVFYDESAYYDFLGTMKMFYKNKGKNFANAREVRKFIEQIVFNQNVRVAEIPKEDRTEDDIKSLKTEDFINLIRDTNQGKKPIGFTPVMESGKQK